MSRNRDRKHASVERVNVTDSVGAVLHAVRAAGAAEAAPWTSDSRQIRPGDVFVAWPGAIADGRRFVAEALASGASCALVEESGADAFELPPRTIRVRGLKAMAGALADAWYGHPSRHMTVLAVTGTNGKTSCALWAAQALAAAGRSCGVVGTLGVGLPDALVSTGLTTPDPVRLHQELASMRAQGIHYCAIEASSIGIEEARLGGLRIHAAAFTNLTQDHLDYHGTMDDYAVAKRRLFEWPHLAAAVLNIDDPMGAELVRHCHQRGVVSISVSLSKEADWRGKAAARGDSGMRLQVCRGDREAEVNPPVLGQFNASNLLVVSGLLEACGLDFEAIVKALGAVTPPPGRMQAVGGRSAPLAVVDYAHTPDALGQALQTLRPIAQVRGGKLWCVFGAGGDRDRSKRGAMAAAAEAFADRLVITSDNPRGEDPQAIANDLLEGVVAPAQVLIALDREQAIAQTIAHADTSDVVLLAGKGHEAVQEKNGQKIPFSDVFHARMALVARAGGLFAVRELAAWTHGQSLGDAGAVVSRVCTDTRQLAAGDLFVALRGERFDAHDFLPRAVAAGASAVLAEHGVSATGLPGVEVSSSLEALGLLARAWRRQQAAMPLAAITGSNGKTTVTQMVAAIFAAWLGETRRLATQGNYNNAVGLPLTLMRLRPHHLAGVVELGMNHPGEVAQLARIAEPTVALVNNAQREHQEFMHTVEAVARENGSVLAALPRDGVAIFPANDEFAPLWSELSGSRRCLRFMLVESAQTRGDAEVVGWIGSREGDAAMRLYIRSPAGEAHLNLRVTGAHNAHNALAATATALACGAPLDAIVAGLEGFEPVSGRMQRSEVLLGDGHRLTLIDDTYNANPDSVRAAITALAAMDGQRLLILGDMGEVGSQGPNFHAEAGHYVAARAIDALWAVGELARHAAQAASGGAVAVRHAATVEALALLEKDLHAFDVVLVKGSRFMQMERVVQAIRALAKPTPGQLPKEDIHAA